VFWRNYFDVLLVDDEPDVLQVSKLALKNAKYLDVPLRIHVAATKSDAIDLLRDTTPLGEIAVGVIDVVMETEHAGLELCEHIRGARENKTMQLIIRTGQPGTAPERSVIDRFDISGYVNKTEVTDDRLYCLVRAGMNSWAALRTSAIGFQLLNSLISAKRSPGGVLDRLHDFIQYRIIHFPNGRRVEGLDVHHAWFLGPEERYYGRFANPEHALATRQRLAMSQSKKINLQGDEYFQEGQYFLIRAAQKPASAPAELLAEVNYAPPSFVLDTFASVLNGMRNLAS
jgi:CheY-like chemotaxis protein